MDLYIEGIPWMKLTGVVRRDDLDEGKTGHGPGWGVRRDLGKSKRNLNTIKRIENGLRAMMILVLDKSFERVLSHYWTILTPL